MEDNPWQLVKRTRAYENPWIAVDHDDVLNAAGNPGIYGVVRFKNLAIGIVTLDDDGYTTLIGQWRYPLERYSWEIPEGGGPKNEAPIEAAKRELVEETGITANKWTKLIELDLSNSVTDEEGIIFLAEDLTLGEATPEETEVFQTERVLLSDAVQMVLKGEIRDSLAVAGLLAAERFVKLR
ncbi:MAG: NUDIX domain-containing protein [Saprospiraceae bacterium]